MLSKLNPCIITFPNVNPYTLEVNKTVRIQVDAISDSSSIKEITIKDERGETLFNKEYDSTINTRVTESLHIHLNLKEHTISQVHWLI